MMSGFGTKLVERWNDWQLIGAVLLSLLVQLPLLGTAGARKRAKPRRRSKIYFWALHVGSRYITTYPLSVLSRASSKDPNADIQAFWAALLLFHLGRPDDFTALSLEDNMIWHRQGFELFVQAVITAYVFCRYCVDEDFKHFILPFLLISLAGLLKCGEQVYALKEATMEALIKSVLGTAEAGPDYADTMDRVDGMLRSGVLPSLNIDNKRLLQPNSGSPVADETREHPNLTIITSAYSLFKTFKVLFADGIFSFEDRLDSQALFKDKDAKWAFKVIEIELSFMYDRLYTKASVSRTRTGMIIRVASLLLTIAGSVYTILKTMHSTQYKLRHRWVTYTLLGGAVFTEFVILARYVYSIWSLVGSDWLKGWPLVGSKSLKYWSVHLVKRRRWSGYMAQSNLITFCVQKLPSDSQLKKFFDAYSRAQSENRIYRLLSAFASGFFLAFDALLPTLRCGQGEPALDEVVRATVSRYSEKPSVLEQLQSKKFWKKYKKARYIKVQEKHKVFIFEQVKEKEAIFNKEEMKNALNQTQEENQATGTPVDLRKAFIDCKGEWALKEEEVDSFLGWSFQGKDFDESLLLWHIATDLCFRQEKYSTSTDQPANLQVNSDSGNDSTDQVILEVNPDNDIIQQQPEDHKDFGNEISNYLMYIMAVHPLMLSSSTTMSTKRCRDTCAEARRFFLIQHIRNKKPSVDGPISDENAHTYLLKVKTTLRASAVKGDKSKSVLWDGCFLANLLMKQIPNKGKRWTVISRVWVEMLCYAAVQCGGYQHAERLKEGGELITFVCLLMTHLGMGKHYRTEFGDAFAHLSPFDPQSASRPAPSAQAQGVQQNATTSAAGEASTSSHGKQAATTTDDGASTSGHGKQAEITTDDGASTSGHGKQAEITTDDGASGHSQQ